MPLPVLVRNNEAGPTVFTDAATKEWVDWAGADDESGDDVQVVPESFLSNAKFLQGFQRGSFSLENPEEHPELAERLTKYEDVKALKAQRARADSRRAAYEEQATAPLIFEADNDVVVLDCIGPARGGNHCEAKVTVKSNKKNSAPPLCPKHAGLAHEYVPEESWVGRSKVVRWNRVQITRRERQES